MTFNWSGQSGQPTWLWGSNDGVDNYVWNPSNFSVNFATTAGNVSSISNAVGSGYEWTASQHFRSNGNTGTINSPPLQAYSDNAGGAIMAFHRAGQYAINMGLDSDNVFRIGGWSAAASRLQMDMTGNLTMSGFIRAGGGHVYTDSNYGYGLVGLYSSTRYQNVFSMGSAYTPASDGTSLDNMYGIAWTHTNVGGQSKSGLSHQALFVNSGVTQSAIGTGIWTIGDITAFSDARVKKDVEVIDNAMARVEQIRGVNFTRISDDVRSTGVIAQEVQAVLPEAVVEDAEGMLSVKYGNMVGLLIEAVKDLNTEIKELKAQIAALKGEA
jgi:hypothetical protein